MTRKLLILSLALLLILSCTATVQPITPQPAASIELGYKRATLAQPVTHLAAATTNGRAEAGTK